jgi:L-alanine-DL-glutamate epimerase-like enolase superfamily enzyme
MALCITDIRIRHFAIPLDPPFRASWDHEVRTRFSATLVEVHTNEGLVGYGSGDAMYGFDQFKHLFIGQEVTQMERHSDVLTTLAFHYARYWPLEIALWDVLGKAANMPLFRLWGGHSSRVPAYCSTGELHEPARRVDEVLRLREQGFRAVKIRMRHEDVHRDLEVVSAVREAVGDTMEIMVDTNQGWRMPGDPRRSWDVKRALGVARELEQFGIYWLEEPLEHTNFNGLTELRHATSLRIAVGELNRSPADFREYIVRGCADVLQPDIVICGGFSLGLKVAHLCEQHGLLFSPHTWGNGLGLMANLHLAGATGLCPFIEYPLDPPSWTLERRDFILAEPIRVSRDGNLELSDKPGLGIDLREDLDQFEVR